MNVVYADSEEVYAQDGSAKNIIDGDPTTFWHTRWQGAAKPNHPHQVVIDLGREYIIGGLRYLPRQEMVNGRVRDSRIFVSEKPFSGLENK
jgi:beta-galactosidase